MEGMCEADDQGWAEAQESPGKVLLVAWRGLRIWWRLLFSLKGQTEDRPLFWDLKPLPAPHLANLTHGYRPGTDQPKGISENSF